ncbi:hypothetical protein [Mesoplasma seiffertii]|uniref:hypothetical protein n=1 Tax=Mesoplasma seiffertii TaxID=28224 RepID=UPI000478D598|nr:hypothetical protein [Mesoplasma seiffertii]
MESVLEKLEKASKTIDETSYKIIAQEILKNFFAGVFNNQEALAKQCYVAVSQVTKFSKKIGYSGYRELLFNLKNEYKHYGWDQNENEVTSIEKFNQITKWISKNYRFVRAIVQAIKAKETINIYASYQVRHAAKYIVELFSSMDKVVKIISNELRNDMKPNKADEINLVLLCSRDNESLIRVFKAQNNPEQQSFLVTTERQKEKMKMPFEEIMLIDYNFDKSKKVYRNLAIEMLFMYIFENIQELSN